MRDGWGSKRWCRRQRGSGANADQIRGRLIEEDLVDRSHPILNIHSDLLPCWSSISGTTRPVLVIGEPSQADLLVEADPGFVKITKPLRVLIGEAGDCHPLPLSLLT